MTVGNICYMTVSNIAHTDAYGAQKRLLWIALHIPMTHDSVSCNIMNAITMIDILMPAWASAGQSKLDSSRGSGSASSS